MSPHRIADLTPEQLQDLERAEARLGVILIAYTEPPVGDPEDSVLDALVDDYRTYDPH